MVQNYFQSLPNELELSQRRTASSHVQVTAAIHNPASREIKISMPSCCSAGCLLSGNETVTIVMDSPAGVKSVVQPLTFKKAEGVYEATITALEVGLLLPIAHC